MRRWILVLTGLLMTGTAAADEIPEGLSVYLGATTNSLFRGVSQTTDQSFYHRGGMSSMGGKTPSGMSSTTAVDDQLFAPAVYGGLDYLHNSGLYGSVDATTLNIPGFDAFARVDGSVGYFQRFNSGWRIDAGVTLYTYPGEFDSNFWEVYAGGGYGPVSGKIWHDPVNHNTYLQGQLRFEIGSGVQLYLIAGHYSFDVGPNYENYEARIVWSFERWTVGGGLSDTSLDSAIPYFYVSYRFPL